MISGGVFRGILGLATIAIGLFAVIYNDKTVGVGLITAGVAILSAEASTLPPLPASKPEPSP